MVTVKSDTWLSVVYAMSCDGMEMNMEMKLNIACKSMQAFLGYNLFASRGILNTFFLYRNNGPRTAVRNTDHFSSVCGARASILKNCASETEAVWIGKRFAHAYVLLAG